MQKDVYQIFMPYCLEKVADGRYIVLNRNYKPLGHLGAEWIDYNTHPSAVAMSITSKTAEKLSWKNDPDTEKIYLYNDGTSPASGNSTGYFKRLAFFSTLGISFQD